MPPCGTKTTRHRSNQHETLLTPKAGLNTLVTEVVACQINGRDGAVLLEGLSQCLDCGTKSTTPRSSQHQTLLTPKGGHSTLVTDVVGPEEWS